MSTDRIYRTNVYAFTNTSVITGICEKNGCDVISAAASVFYPEGGGQPSDTGSVRKGGTVYNIIRAYDESIEGDVWHVTDAPSGTFTAGDEIVFCIDRIARSCNMQRHLGEHMLSGAFHSLFGGVNKGFHMGQDYITIDIDLDGRMLTREELDLAQQHVNEAVWADLPVTVTWFDSYEESLVMPVRKQVPHDGRVSVVTVGDLHDPYDCIACCGTHPARSSEVGLVAIYKCEPNKGMNRVYFDCGRPALARLSADSQLLAEVSRRYSCSPSDIISRLDAEAEHISSLRTKLAGLTAYVKENEKARILADIASLQNEKAEAAVSRNDTADACSNTTVIYTYSSEILSPDDLLKLGFSVINERSNLLLLMKHPETSTCVLLSSSTDFKCGRLVKSHAPEFDGRGGGRDDNARALFKNSSDLNAFTNKIASL